MLPSFYDGQSAAWGLPFARGSNVEMFAGKGNETTSSRTLEVKEACLVLPISQKRANCRTTGQCESITPRMLKDDCRP